MASRSAIFFLFILLLSCNNQRQQVVSSVLKADTSLHLQNGLWFYNKKVFTGSITDLHENGNKFSVENIKNGKQEGYNKTFYPNGERETLRWYSNGEKDSVHYGWWQNGNLKFEYHFKQGKYHGLFTEWYANGKMYQQVQYSDGEEQGAKGWRESGALFMNFVVKHGRRYGINNSNMCYTLNNENVQP